MKEPLTLNRDYTTFEIVVEKEVYKRQRLGNTHSGHSHLLTLPGGTNVRIVDIREITPELWEKRMNEALKNFMKKGEN